MGSLFCLLFRHQARLEADRQLQVKEKNKKFILLFSTIITPSCHGNYIRKCIIRSSSFSPPCVSHDFVWETLDSNKQDTMVLTKLDTTST